MTIKIVTTTTRRQIFLNDRLIAGFNARTKVSAFAAHTREIKFF